jgi:hypothetical protein
VSLLIILSVLELDGVVYLSSSSSSSFLFFFFFFFFLFNQAR